MLSSDTAPASRRDSGASPLPSTPFLDGADLTLTARTDACVLITGRVQVGHLALEIHNFTGARWGTFQAVECSAAPQVLETQLFGVLENDIGTPSVSGVGLRLRQPGTLFLHEVGWLSGSAQARLRDLIALSAAASGGTRVRRRIIASASNPLLPRVQDGTFDDRLYYLLNVIHFDLRQELMAH
jgi:two-component system response regulator HydG